MKHRRSEGHQSRLQEVTGSDSTGVCWISVRRWLVGRWCRLRCCQETHHVQTGLQSASEKQCGRFLQWEQSCQSTGRHSLQQSTCPSQSELPETTAAPRSGQIPAVKGNPGWPAVLCNIWLALQLCVDIPGRLGRPKDEIPYCLPPSCNILFGDSMNKGVVKIFFSNEKGARMFISKTEGRHYLKHCWKRMLAKHHHTAAMAASISPLGFWHAVPTKLQKHLFFSVTNQFPHPWQWKRGSTRPHIDLRMPFLTEFI